MFYGDVKSAWEPLEMQAWLTKQSKQALSFTFHCCALPFFSALCCFPVDIVALGKVGRCLCIYVCTDFSTRPFQFWTCVACMWVFFYTNHNLVDEWHMFGQIWQSARLSSVDSYLPLMMSRRSQVSHVRIFFRTRNLCLQCIIIGR